VLLISAGRCLCHGRERVPAACTWPGSRPWPATCHPFSCCAATSRVCSPSTARPWPRHRHQSTTRPLHRHQAMGHSTVYTHLLLKYQPENYQTSARVLQRLLVPIVKQVQEFCSDFLRQFDTRLSKLPVKMYILELTNLSTDIWYKFCQNCLKMLPWKLSTRLDDMSFQLVTTNWVLKYIVSAIFFCIYQHCLNSYSIYLVYRTWSSQVMSEMHWIVAFMFITVYSMYRQLQQ